MTEYNAALCAERHATINARLSKQEAKVEELLKELHGVKMSLARIMGIGFAALAALQIIIRIWP